MCVLSLGLAPLAARADVIYNLNGTLTGGSTVSGTFTTNNAMTSLTGANLTASASGGFAGFTYTLVNSSVASSLPTQYFQLDAPGQELRIYFSLPGLTASGATIAAANSYESDSRGNLSFTSGTVVRAAVATTPEPSSLVLLGTGVMGLVGAARKRLMA